MHITTIPKNTANGTKKKEPTHIHYFTKDMSRLILFLIPQKQEYRFTSGIPLCRQSYILQEVCLCD